MEVGIKERIWAVEVGIKERILKGGGRGGQWRWELRRGY